MKLFYIIMLFMVNIPPVFSQSQTPEDALNNLQVSANYACNATMVYHFTSEVTMSAHDQPIVIQAQIEKTPVLIINDGVLFKYTFRTSTFEGLPTIQVAEMIKQIDRIIYAFHNHHGEVKALYGSTQSPIWDYNAAKAIILSTQFILPEQNQSPDNYQKQESDDKGIAVAQYTVTPTGIIKTRKFYEKLWSEGMNLNITNSQTEIHLNQKRVVDKMDIREHFNIGTANNPIFSTDYHQQLVLKEVKTVPQEKTDSCPYSSLQDIINTEKLTQLPFHHVINEDSQKQQMKEQLKGVDLDGLLTVLRAGDSQSETRTKALIKLVDLFTYYPNTLQQVPLLIEQEIENKKFVQYLIAGVIYAKCEEAQSTLLAIMKKFADHPSILEQAIEGHHFVAVPAQANIDYLISLYQKSDHQELKKLIILALGSISKKVDAVKSEAREHLITKFILSELDQAKDKHAKFALIKALGNGGDIAAFETLKKIFAQSQDPEISSWVVDAMRQMRVITVDNELAKILKDSHEESVQLAVLRALQGRDLSSDEVVQLIIANYFTFKTTSKLEVLTLLSEPQLLRKTSVLKFLKELSKSEDLSEAESNQLKSIEFYTDTN